MLNKYNLIGRLFCGYDVYFLSANSSLAIFVWQI